MSEELVPVGDVHRLGIGPAHPPGIIPGVDPQQDELGAAHGVIGPLDHALGGSQAVHAAAGPGEASQRGCPATGDDA
jgi:hypothetical protein